MKMAKRFSFTASKDCYYRYFFAYAGLRSVITTLGGGGGGTTSMHCWVPRTHNHSKPTLLLIHGFGANAMWQYSELLRHFVPHYNVYVPDLLFFGQSSTEAPERTEAFQARCLMELMAAHGVRKMSLVGISYGGFVGYSMAAQFPEATEKVALCCAGVCLEEKDMEERLFKVTDSEAAASILLPQTPEKLRELMRLSFVKPAKRLPTCFLCDFIHVMCSDHLQEKRELIQEILKDRRLSDIPKIHQSTLIIWGEQDQVFPLELGHRLKRHIGENCELVIIKNAGHAVNLEKPKEFTRHLKAFLLGSLLSSPNS